MTHHIKISIIIPVYNAGPLLSACLDSAIQQSLKEIEIICVNDCSTDSSATILDKFANDDKRVKVINHDSNKGAATARNTGLAEAKGKYVFYLDADDALPSDAMEKLYTEAANYGSDMVKGGFDVIHDEKVIESDIWSTPVKRTLNTNISESRFLRKIPTSHVTYLYNRRFLNQHNIRYRTDLMVGEDLVALATALIHANTVTLIPDIVYHYNQTKSSLMRGKLSIAIAEDAIRTKKIIIDMLNEKDMHEAAKPHIQSWDYIISTQWLRMPSSLTADECSHVFSAFRDLVCENNVTPWLPRTPHQYRYILALLLDNRDEEALSFLGTEDATEGFSSQEELVKSLEFILTKAPGDAGALTELGNIAIKVGDLEKGLHLLEEIIKHDSDNFSAHLQSAYILEDLERYEESCIRLNVTLEILYKETDSQDQINRVKKANIDLIRLEKKKVAAELNMLRKELSSAHEEISEIRRELNSARGELHKVRGELNTVYNSNSWRMTEPLRKVVSAIKGKT